MTKINRKRVALGALVGGVVWSLWSGLVVHSLILGDRYAQLQEQGQLLAQPRYPYFLPVWILSLFVLSYILAWLYASVRDTLGPGPRTALQLGFLVGFAISFPLNFSTATWAPLPRSVPLWWMLDLWLGALVVAYLVGWLYQPSEAESAGPVQPPA